MTENEASNAPLSDEVQEVARTDWLLNLLPNLAELGLHMPVTLNVKGITVTGYVIPFKRYLEGVVEQLDEPGNKHAKVTSELFNNLKNQIFPVGEEQSNKSDEPHKSYEHIHLENARIISGNGFSSADSGLYWRGRLDQVDGFSFGFFESA